MFKKISISTIAFSFGWYSRPCSNTDSQYSIKSLYTKIEYLCLTLETINKSGIKDTKIEREIGSVGFSIESMLRRYESDSKRISYDQKFEKLLYKRNEFILLVEEYIHNKLWTTSKGIGDYNVCFNCAEYQIEYSYNDYYVKINTEKWKLKKSYNYLVSEKIRLNAPDVQIAHLSYLIINLSNNGILSKNSIFLKDNIARGLYSLSSILANRTIFQHAQELFRAVYGVNYGECLILHDFVRSLNNDQGLDVYWHVKSDPYFSDEAIYTIYTIPMSLLRTRMSEIQKHMSVFVVDNVKITYSTSHQSYFGYSDQPKTYQLNRYNEYMIFKNKCLLAIEIELSHALDVMTNRQVRKTKALIANSQILLDIGNEVLKKINNYTFFSIPTDKGAIHRRISTLITKIVPLIREPEKI